MTDTSLSPASTEPAATAPQPDTGRPLTALLNDLTHPEATTRLEAVQQLGHLEIGERSALSALEKAAAQDDSLAVREAALLAW